MKQRACKTLLLSYKLFEHEALGTAMTGAETCVQVKSISRKVPAMLPFDCDGQQQGRLMPAGCVAQCLSGSMRRICASSSFSNIAALLIEHQTCAAMRSAGTLTLSYCSARFKRLMVPVIQLQCGTSL